MLFADRKIQLAFAEYVRDTLQAYPHAIIHSFLHQLLIQILLDEQHVVINFSTKKSASASSSSLSSNSCVLWPPNVKNAAKSSASTTSITSNCTNSLLTHPKCKLGASGLKPIELPLSKTIHQLIDTLDVSQGNAFSLTSKPSMPVRLCLLDPVTGREKLIPNDYTLESVYNVYLKRLEEAGKSELTSEHDLTLSVYSGGDSHHELLVQEASKDAQDMLSSPLDAFVSCGGLMVLAERLPVLMPFIREPLLTVTDKDRSGANGVDSKANGANQPSQYQQQMPKISPDFVDYVIMNESDAGPFIDDMYNEMPIQTTTTAMTANLNGIFYKMFFFSKFILT